MHSKTIKVVIVDDDEEDIELIEEALRAFDPTIEVQKFSTGILAVAYLDSLADQELPCLIILDYNLPLLSGDKIFLQIQSQARYHAIPKIILSSSDAPPYVRESLANEPAEYLVKPNSTKELAMLAKKLIEWCYRKRV
jgi:CheY-like chemotaxis protein